MNKLLRLIFTTIQVCIFQWIWFSWWWVNAVIYHIFHPIECLVWWTQLWWSLFVVLPLHAAFTAALWLLAWLYLVLPAQISERFKKKFFVNLESGRPLLGRVAVVTGASRGIGAGIAKALADAGATVYATARTVTSDESPSNSPGGSLQAVAGDIHLNGGRCIPVRCDSSDDNQLQALFERVEREQGRLDILVNNAFTGVDDIREFMGVPFFAKSPKVWDQVNAVGLRSHYVASVYGAKLMTKCRTNPPFAPETPNSGDPTPMYRRVKGTGLIVHVSSWGGLRYLFDVAYGAGKCGLDRMTMDMATELRNAGVSVVSLWPGRVRTERLVELAVRHHNEICGCEHGPGAADAILEEKNRMKMLEEGEVTGAGGSLSPLSPEHSAPRTGLVVFRTPTAAPGAEEETPSPSPSQDQINESKRTDSNRNSAVSLPPAQPGTGEGLGSSEEVQVPPKPPTIKIIAPRVPMGQPRPRRLSLESPAVKRLLSCNTFKGWFYQTETPIFCGRTVAALACVAAESEPQMPTIQHGTFTHRVEDRLLIPSAQHTFAARDRGHILRRSGTVQVAAEVGAEFGVVDEEGKRASSFRSLRYQVPVHILPRLRGWERLIPDVRLPWELMKIFLSTPRFTA